MSNTIEQSGLIPKEVVTQWEKNNPTRKITMPDFMQKKKIKRSTYCWANAELLRPLFDLIISEGKGKTLPWNSLPNVSPQTLYIKITDALKFLIENEVDAVKRASYTLLKAMYKISPAIDGVAFTARNSNQTSISGMMRDSTNIKINSSGATIIGAMCQDNGNENKTEPKPEVKSWRDLITNFVNDTANEDAKLTLKVEGGALQDDEKIWIANVFSGCNNIDFLINGNEIQMMKVKI